MWVLFDGGRFVALVAHKPGPSATPLPAGVRGPFVVVRGRVKQDVADFLALAARRHGYKVLKAPAGDLWDYQFRAVVPKRYARACMDEAVRRMEYRSLKTSIPHTVEGSDRYRVAVDVWNALKPLAALDPSTRMHTKSASDAQGVFRA